MSCLSAIVAFELTRELMNTDIVMPLHVSPIFLYFSLKSRQKYVASFYRFSVFLGERAFFFLTSVVSSSWYSFCHHFAGMWSVAGERKFFLCKY